MSSSKEDKELLAPEQKYNDLSAFVDSLSESYSDPKKLCKLCNSPSKAEAHSMYEKGRPATAVHKWLTEEKKEEISYGAVNNHLTHHLKSEKDNLNLKEFATQLSKWSELNMDSEVIMNRYIKMFDREATLLLSKNDELPVFEVRKNIETALKIATLIGSYKEQLHSLHAEKRPVELVVMSLNRIIQVKIQDSTPEVKRVLQDVVEQLSREVGDYAVDGEQVVEN
jgi:hypothetical protein